MNSGKVIDIIHHASGDHCPRAAGTFLRRLENQLDHAVQPIGILFQNVGQPRPIAV
jgi:hypothetical protein